MCVIIFMDQASYMDPALEKFSVTDQVFFSRDPDPDFVQVLGSGSGLVIIHFFSIFFFDFDPDFFDLDQNSYYGEVQRICGF